LIQAAGAFFLVAPEQDDYNQEAQSNCPDRQSFPDYLYDTFYIEIKTAAKVHEMICMKKVKQARSLYF